MKKNGSDQTSFTRRSFLRHTVKVAGASMLLSGVPRGWVGSVYASDAPETKTMKFGMIALTDCSPIVIAHEKGLFKKYGIQSTVAKGANWAAIRDSLSSGDNPGHAHAHRHADRLDDGPARFAEETDDHSLAAQSQRPGHLRSKTEWKGKVTDDPKALKPFVDEAKKKGEPLTFAMTFPPGTHAMWMRYYLAAGGINPDKDVALITVPPRADGGQHEDRQDGRLLRGRTVERARHRGQDWLHFDYSRRTSGRIIRKKSARSPLSSRRKIRRRVKAVL